MKITAYLCGIKLINKQIMKYISFVGHFDELPNQSELLEKYPVKIADDGYIDPFRPSLTYIQIDQVDSLYIYLAKISDGIGHIVADCSAGGWTDDAFIALDENDNPVKSPANYNPNPVEQLV